MCLAVPMKITAIDGFQCTCEAKGIEREVSLFMMQNETIEVGDHILVHVGYAIQKVSEEEAAESWALFDEVLAEIPRVREDLGFIPLVTPTSQIVGTQAVINVLMGERYKTITNEVKLYLQGGYGKAPGQVDENLRRQAIGSEDVTLLFEGASFPSWAQ